MSEKTCLQYFCNNNNHFYFKFPIIRDNNKTHKVLNAFMLRDFIISYDERGDFNEHFKNVQRKASTKNYFFFCVIYGRWS